MKAKKIVGNEIKKGDKMWQMWDISLFGSSTSSLLELVEKHLASNQVRLWVATVNPEFVMTAIMDENFKSILAKTSINVVDGVGLIWAKEVLKFGKSKVSKLWIGLRLGVEIMQGKHREALITGVDLMDACCQMAERLGKTVYFFGGWEDRAKRTAKYFINKYPKLKVAGARAEDFEFEKEMDFLFVARGMKTQEEWIDNNLAKLKAGVIIGVGRSFDYYSGDLKRAPSWVRKMGLEWLYSLYKDPARWRRQMVLPKFVWRIIWGL